MTYESEKINDILIKRIKEKDIVYGLQVCGKNNDPTCDYFRYRKCEPEDCSAIIFLKRALSYESEKNK